MLPPQRGVLRLEQSVMFSEWIGLLCHGWPVGTGCFTPICRDCQHSRVLFLSIGKGGDGDLLMFLVAIGNGETYQLKEDRELRTSD